MKYPAKVFLHEDEKRFKMYKGEWVIKQIEGIDTEYIRRDVVIKALERMKTVMPCDIVNLDVILNQIIDNADNERS